MDYDFLPSKPKQEKPNTSSGSGSKFTVGKNVFFDDYLNHLDAHRLFSTPPIRSEFKLVENYDIAMQYFSKKRILDNIDSDWYGEKTLFDKLISGYTEFQNIPLLNEVINQLNDEIPDELFSNIEKPKIKINDKFGMFSYDLASMAMTYVYEYFNALGEKVDSNFVVKIGSDFYFENEIVTQKIKLRENGTPVVISSVRNCLIDFEKQKKKERSVEIFISNSASYKIEAKEFIYNSMAAISVAQKLLLRGFKVKITCLVIGKVNDRYYFHFVPTKRFNQPMDINATAYVCGDTRFFRYQGFKLFISGCDKDNKPALQGIAIPVNDLNFIHEQIEKDYVLNSKLSQADTRLYFGNSRTINEVKNEVKEALIILEKKYGTKN